MPLQTIWKGDGMPTTGRYENSDGQPVVHFERTLPHPTAVVWEAVTDPAQLAQWFPTTVEFDRLAPGAAIAFAFADNAYPPMSGEVLEVQAQRRLSFTWGDDRLTFELEPESGDTACRLSFSVVLDGAGKAARDAAGWDQCLDMLALLAAGRMPPRPAAGDRWRAYYEEYKRLGLPAEAAVPE